MVRRSLLMYVLLVVLLVDVSIVFSLKTSKKHESMISKSTKQTETKSSEGSEPESVAVPEKAEESHVAKKSTPDAATVAASASAAKPGSTENKDNSQTVDETAIGLLEDPIEKDEGAVVAEETALMGTTPGFLITRFREVFVQLLRMFGLRTASSKRKHRQMDMDDGHEYPEENVIEPSNYKEQIRTTVGAVLGRPDCIKRAACRAGRYLRDVKGKDIIIVILEKVTPSKWLETVQVVKDSAIHNDECNYKCLED